MFVVCFYLIVFAASLALAGTFFYRNRRVDVLVVFIFATVISDNFGQFLISVSKNAEQAVWGVKLVYIGSCFCPVFMMLLMAKLCELRIPKIITALMTAFSGIVDALTLTIGYSDIYYKNVSIADGGGYSYVVKEYGPMHSAFTVLLGFDVLFLIYIIICAFRQRKKIPFRTVLLVCGSGVVIIAAYLLSRLFGSTIEWKSAAYLVAIFVFMRLLEHINMYDMITNIATSVERMKEYGFIVFDNRHRYINANEVVKGYFPEINDWKTQQVVKPSDSEFYREVITWFNAWCSGEQNVKMLRLSEQYLELSVRDVVFGKRKKKVGDLIEIIDRTAEHNYTAKVESYNAELAAEVEAKTAHINEIRDKMVIGMAAMVESRDNSTGGHIQRTSEVVKMFSVTLLEHASLVGTDREFIEMVVRAAPMHDLGKIAVDDAILKKQGKFTDEEYAEMKKHSAYGAEIVRRILKGVEDDRFVEIAENVAHYHHEKWNGKGYPEGLSGQQIPLEARIMALADVFDALVSNRCYKDAFSYDKAFEIIQNDSGTHFDPVLGKLFIGCRPELERFYNAINADE